MKDGNGGAAEEADTPLRRSVRMDAMFLAVVVGVIIAAAWSDAALWKWM